MKKVTTGILAFSIVAILGVSFVTAFPNFGFNGSKNRGNVTEDKIAEMQSFQNSVRDAIKNDDFESWKSLMESQLTQENFDSLVERYNQTNLTRESDKEIMNQIQDAVNAGDFELVQQLRENLSSHRPLHFDGMKDERVHFGNFSENSSE